MEVYVPDEDSTNMVYDKNQLIKKNECFMIF